MEDTMEDDVGQLSDLHRVVKANEDIKKVIHISLGVNLVALNAMLIAKRSGVRSRGFAVVSSELRVFSHNLDGAMAGLGTQIFELVRDASAMQKQQQERRHFCSVIAKGPSMRKLAEPALARVDERIGGIGDAIRRDWHKLRLQLNQVLQLCEAGRSLSRSAKIEAVYGGDMSVTLKQVANQIEETVSEIFFTLKQLRMQLAE